MKIFKWKPYKCFLHRVQSFVGALQKITTFMIGIASQFWFFLLKTNIFFIYTFYSFCWHLFYFFVVFKTFNLKNIDSKFLKSRFVRHLLYSFIIFIFLATRGFRTLCSWTLSTLAGVIDYWLITPAMFCVLCSATSLNFNQFKTSLENRLLSK